jgi:hypothetical protein
MCPCDSFCDEWLSTWSTKKVEWWLTLPWQKLCVWHVSWLYCAGVELGGGDRRWGEGQVETCRVDGLRAVKGRREAQTKRPGDRVTSRGGWHLGHRQAQVYMRVTVLTESSRRTYKSSEAQRTWWPAGWGWRWHVSSSGGHVWSMLLASGFGSLGFKTISGGFTGLGLKTRTEVPRRNRRHVATSGSSCRGKATNEEARWPSDEVLGVCPIGYHRDDCIALYPWHIMSPLNIH